MKPVDGFKGGAPIAGSQGKLQPGQRHGVGAAELKAEEKIVLRRVVAGRGFFFLGDLRFALRRSRVHCVLSRVRVLSRAL